MFQQSSVRLFHCLKLGQIISNASHCSQTDRHDRIYFHFRSRKHRLNLIDNLTGNKPVSFLLRFARDQYELRVISFVNPSKKEGIDLSGTQFNPHLQKSQFSKAKFCLHSEVRFDNAEVDRSLDEPRLIFTTQRLGDERNANGLNWVAWCVVFHRKFIGKRLGLIRAIRDKLEASALAGPLDAGNSLCCDGLRPILRSARLAHEILHKVGRVSAAQIRSMGFVTLTYCLGNVLKAH